MKKIFALFLLMLTFISTQGATFKLYATYDVVGNGNTNISYDASTYTFTISGKNSNTYQILGFQAGTLNKYETLHLNISAKNGTVNVLFVDNTQASSNQIRVTKEITATGGTTINLSDISYRSAINEIRITGERSTDVSTPYTFTLDPSTVYLESAEYTESMTITTTLNSSSTYATPFQWIANPGASQTDYTTALTNNFGQSKSNDVLFGYSSGNAISKACINLVGYDRAFVTLASVSAGPLRFLNESSSNTAIEPQDKATQATWNATVPYKYCTTLKVGSNAAMNVTSIDYIKEYDAASTVAFNIAASTSSAVAYDRSFTAGQKSTVCLPFALTAEEVSAAGTFYTLSSVSDGTLTFTEVETTEAYKPYIFVAKTTGTPFSSMSNKAIPATAANNTTKGNYTFTGTLSASTDVASFGTAVYGFSSSDGSFKKAGTGVSINAFRAVIVGPAAAARSLNAIYNDGETTTVKIINNNGVRNQQEYYNMQGQCVGRPTKGLYIKNNRKVLVK